MVRLERNADRREGIACAMAVGAAVLLGAWLRTHGLAGQFVQDDEWHALHKLLNSGYLQIVRSFGVADHSIPLTLFYKALAETIGLDEVNMRALQVLAGTATVALAGWLAWRTTRDAPLAALLAFAIAIAPLLVLYSRTARPYAITTLLAVGILAMTWRWRTERSLRGGAAIAATTAVATWLHPLILLYPATAIAFVLAEDGARKPRRIAPTLALGTCAAGASMLLLAPALLGDYASLAGKAGRDYAGWATAWSAVSLALGGFSDAVTALLCAFALAGAVAVWRRDARLGAFLACLFVVPAAVVLALGGHWSHQPHTYARYVFPSQVILLAWTAAGIAWAVEALSARAPVRGIATAAVIGAYVATAPTLRQVLDLGPWYGHVIHQFDYRPERNAALHQYDGFRAPAFYDRLATMPPGSATVIEAPFTFAAPSNAMAFFALRHRQHVLGGFVHDLCLEGPRRGEVPHDARFRFRDFVFLDHPDEVARSGARYIVLYTEQFDGVWPFARAPQCIAALTRLYGEPMLVDSRHAVFDLTRAPSHAPARG